MDFVGVIQPLPPIFKLMTFNKIYNYFNNEILVSLSKNGICFKIKTSSFYIYTNAYVFGGE